MGQHRIIVIGAGVSGLGCAKELVQRGYDVLVIEARSRVGGRLKGEPLEVATDQSNQDDANRTNTTTTTTATPTTSIDASTAINSTSQNIDLGGALIHGIENNPIHAITSQMGVPMHSISDYCLLLDENGWPFDPKEDEKLSTLYNECLDITFQRVEQDKAAKTSFGALFDKVCKEKGVSPDNPLLRWHKANLELPTGADFHELGYTWNDDEPYGFAGAHAAPEPSWKFVMDKLADGLDILYNSPVSKIQIVLPDRTTPTDIENVVIKDENQPNKTGPNDTSQLETRDEKNNFDSVEDIEAAAEEATTIRIKRPRRQRVSDTSPSRFSRRLRGEGANLRRSARSNKGVIHMLQIGDGSALCYDDPTKKFQRRKRARKEDDDEKDDETAEPPSSKVQITLQNGAVLEANGVVCTLPLGILKAKQGERGHVKFVPPLAAPKLQAIDELGCGLLNKCAMSFPNVFWQDSDFLGLAGSAHSYLVLNAMKYTQKPILIFMYGGSFARDLEAWADRDIVEDCLRVLKKICGKDVPSPIDYCVTRWGKEQYSKMAFTYIPPGVDGHKQLTTMSEAIYDPILPKKPLIMFAGEHTTPYHPSTMHGAFLSGIREAYRYDLFMEPELNDNMVFEATEKLYAHTFPIRRVFKKPKVQTEIKSNNLASPGNSSNQIRSRRRRFAGMALRKQPKKVIESPLTKKVTPLSPDGSTKSRRSQRSLATKKLMETIERPDSETANEIALKKQVMINELEDRTLMRSLESYGRDCSILRSLIIPVHGSTRKRSADQIRYRWQQLNGRAKRSGIWKSWEASSVVPTPSTKDISPPKTSTYDNLRRSKRDLKPRVLVDA